MEKIFKKGDTVYDPVVARGLEGKVVYIGKGEHSMDVKFGENIFTYTPDGRYFKKVAPTLSFSRYEVNPDQERPRDVPLAGEPVVVWDFGSKFIRISTGTLTGMDILGTPNTASMSKFIPGDRVFHFVYGWGIVSLNSYSVHDSWVKFENGSAAWVSQKILSFTEYTLHCFSQVRNRDIPPQGTPVVVYNEGGSKLVRTSAGYLSSDGLIVVYEAYGKDAMKRSYKHWEPFKPEEL